MANVRQEPVTGTTATGTTAVDDRPQVEVYDTDKATASEIGNKTNTVSSPMTDRATTPPLPSSTTGRNAIDEASTAPNWGGIVLGILVVLALIILLIWLL